MVGRGPVRFGWVSHGPLRSIGISTGEIWMGKFWHNEATQERD